MKVVWTLAWNTFREGLRDRFVLISFFLALALFALSFILGAMSFEEHRRLLLHFGLLAIHGMGLAIAIFWGAYIVHREMDRQTCLMVLVRPVSRTQFLIGKYLGILLLMLNMWMVLGLSLFFLLKFSFSWDAYLVALLGTLLESMSVLAFTMLVSILVQPAIALFGGFAIFLLGYLQKDLFFFARKSQDVFFMNLADLIPWFIPQYFRINFRSSSLIDQGGLWEPFFQGATPVLAWSLVYFSLTLFFFRRKDLV
ncbi:MAG: ABC transporter permease subunit [Planctomycetia bacterium]